jgi:hypothetical protein
MGEDPQTPRPKVDGAISSLGGLGGRSPPFKSGWAGGTLFRDRHNLEQVPVGIGKVEPAAAAAMIDLAIA